MKPYMDIFFKKRNVVKNKHNIRDVKKKIWYARKTPFIVWPWQPSRKTGKSKSRTF